MPPARRYLDPPHVFGAGSGLQGAGRDQERRIAGPSEAGAVGRAFADLIAAEKRRATAVGFGCVPGRPAVG